MNALKWAVVAMLITAGVVGNQLYSDQSLLIRVLVLIALFVATLFIAFQTTSGKKAWDFASEAKSEIRKVVWPTRQETVQMTAIVMAMVVIVGLFLWGVDIILLKAIGWLTGYGA